ncbi:hypothetical protein [Caminibacter sp.]
MKKFFFFFLSFSILLASDITSLLNKIEQQDDLSRKTRMESSGISYIITRYQLDAMQAKTLADVLDNTVIGYLESRYAISDPWSIGYIPYNSIGVRVFIDNQEITSGAYDNALYMLSKIDLSFVDHIEIYYMSPSYALSNEPSYVIIKLYSKDAKRDEGKRIALSYGSYKSNIEAIDYAKPGNYSLYLHLSRLEWNHRKYKVKSSFLNRDSDAKHFLLSVYNQNTHYLLSAIDYRQNAFLGLSLDGNIKTSLINSKLLHFGVDKKIGNFTFKYIVDYGKDKANFEENNRGFLLYSQKYGFIKNIYTEDWTLVNSFNAFYKKRINNNSLILGVGFRNKKLSFNKIDINSNSVEYKGIKNENVFSEYFENTYQYLKNAALSFGLSLFQYSNRFSNNILKSYKIGHTYLFDKNDVLKFFYHHMEFMNADYLVSTILPVNVDKPRKSDVFITKYKKTINTNTFEFTYLKSINKNYIVPTKEGIKVYDKDIPINIFDFRFHRNYNYINDFILETARIYLKNIALKREDYFILMNTHRYRKFQFLENFIYRKNIFSDNVKDGFNVNLGIKYDVNDNLSFALKGYNVFGTRYKNGYYIYDFATSSFKYLNIPLYERSAIFSVEYMF